MECCCHVWVSTPSCNLELLHKLQKQICSTVSSSLATSHEPLAHCQNAASPSLFYSYYFCRCLSELVEMIPLPFSRYSDRVHDFSATISRCYKDVFVKSFFPGAARLWYFLPKKCFPLTSVFSIWRSLRVLQTARIKIVACAICTFLIFFLYLHSPLLLENKKLFSSLSSSAN